MSKKVPVLDQFEFQQPVIDKDITSPPGTPTKGDRYLIITGTGAWASYNNYIAEYTGTVWEYIVPKEGFLLYVRDEAKAYLYNGSTWDIFYNNIQASDILTTETGITVQEKLDILDTYQNMFEIDMSGNLVPTTSEFDTNFESNETGDIVPKA